MIADVPKGLCIGGEWRDAGGGRDPGRSRTRRPARRCARSPTRRPRTRRPRSGRGLRRAGRVGRARRRASAARSCAAPTSMIVARADELALLMTLEMGKPVAESKAEIAYAAEFLRWFSEEAVRIDGRYAVAPDGKGRLLTMKQPVGPCLLITPWNFPTGDGHAQDRPGGRRRLHDGRQAGQADAAVDARAGRRSSRRRACPTGVLNVITAVQLGQRHRAADRGPAAAQAVLHRLDRGRASS